MPVKPPTQQQMAEADYSIPDRIQIGIILKKHLDQILIDPFSAKWEYYPDTPTKYWAVDSDGKYHYGWLIAYKLNAKNRMGGYTGWEKRAFFIERGVFVQDYSLINNDTGLYPPINTMH